VGSRQHFWKQNIKKKNTKIESEGNLGRGRLTGRQTGRLEVLQADSPPAQMHEHKGT